jgi:hypothetical protein
MLEQLTKEFIAVARLLRTMGSSRGGVGSSPPARGSTPAPRPKLGGYSSIAMPEYAEYTEYVVFDDCVKLFA